MGRFLACCLLVLSLAAFGQTPEKNLARLMDLMAANANDAPAELQRKVDELLKTYTDREAFEAQAGVFQWAYKNKVLTPVEMGREMLALNLRYAPRDDVALDLWRYRIMIGAKLERGEIRQEEFDYLDGRKTSEAQREIDRLEAYRPPPPVYYGPPPQVDRTGPMLEAIGAAMKRRRPPVTTTNCAVMGNLVQCQSQ